MPSVSPIQTNPLGRATVPSPLPDLHRLLPLLNSRRCRVFSGRATHFGYAFRLPAASFSYKYVALHTKILFFIVSLKLILFTSTILSAYRKFFSVLFRIFFSSPKFFLNSVSRDLLSSAPSARICCCSSVIRESHTEDFHDFEEFSIMCLPPLDECFEPEMKNLRLIFSEFGLIHYRVMVEVKWLLKLSEIPEVEEVSNFSEDARSFLKAIVDNFSIKDALEVKNIEGKTNHDVKAVEYFLKQRCASCPEIAKVVEFIHFACTSEDINNLAYAISLKEALNSVIFPVMVDLSKAISNLARENAHVSMLSRTHGQPASPTTLGKEMSIFAFRLCNKGKFISGLSIFGKFAGAVGNYNAHNVAYPNVNWPSIAEEFVTSLGIKFNTYVTQIEPHDYIASLFHAFIEFNSILIGFNNDILSYISLGYFKQIDPIDFENSLDNLVMSEAYSSEFATKLPISRMQRDLSDSTVLRNLGVSLAHSLLAYLHALQGIQKLKVNESRLYEDLEHTWEVLAEPIQIVMRRYGIPEPYEKLKEFTRGKTVTKDSITNFIKSLDLPEKAKSDLLELTPHSYTGVAEALAKSLENAVDLSNGFRIQ